MITKLDTYSVKCDGSCGKSRLVYVLNDDFKPVQDMPIPTGWRRIKKESQLISAYLDYCEDCTDK